LGLLSLANFGPASRDVGEAVPLVQNRYRRCSVHDGNLTPQAKGQERVIIAAATYNQLLESIPQPPWKDKIVHAGLAVRLRSPAPAEVVELHLPIQGRVPLHVLCKVYSLAAYEASHRRDERNSSQKVRRKKDIRI